MSTPVAGWLALAACAMGAHPGTAQSRARAPIATTAHFAFYDDVETNLNDALSAAGVARSHSRPELFHSGDQEACFAKLPASARAGWDRAVDYYAEIISPYKFYQRPQYLLRAYLAGYPHRPTDDDSTRFVRIADDLRDAARSAWLACRWPAQEAKNRQWVEDLEPELALYGRAIGRRLEQLYQKRWSGLPMRVDVVETVDWSGANTIILDEGGHILISSEIQGLQALEIVFHEASHTLMGGNAPVREALDKAARAAAVDLPADLWHVVLFYMTGAAVREVLERAGKPGYTPAVYDIFGRDERWDSYRRAIEGSWPAYMDGRHSLEQAASDLVRALPEGDHPRGDDSTGTGHPGS